MKHIEMAAATAALKEYVKRARKEPLVVLDRGRAVAAVVPLDDLDWVDYLVTHHPSLVESTRKSMARYHAQGGVSLEEMKQRYLPAKRVRRAARRTATATARRTRAK